MKVPNGNNNNKEQDKKRKKKKQTNYQKCLLLSKYSTLTISYNNALLLLMEFENYDGI